MKKRAGLFLLILAMGLLIVISVMAGDQSSTSSQISSACDSFGVVKSQVERKALSFCLKTLDGNQVILSDFKGKPVLLKFWATSCPSCVEELSRIQEFSDGRTDQLVILLAAIDGEKEKKVRRLINEKKIALPVLLDPGLGP